MIMNKRSLIRGTGLLALTSLLLTGCASTELPGSKNAGGTSTSETGTADYNTGDITQYCPDKPSKVGYAKGSYNTWVDITVAELKKEAAKCPTITDVIYADAHGDQQKAVSDVNSLAAQGVAAIVVQAEFGAAQIPSIAAANAAGIGTVPTISDPGGKVGVDYPAVITYDNDYFGKTWATWLNKTLGGKGTVVFLGGPAGAASSAGFFDGLSKGLKDYPGLKLAVDGVVDTSWDPGDKKRVMSGLLAQHGRIDAVVTDYGATDTGVIDAYLDAGLDLPALATLASANITGCEWEKHHFDLMTLDGSTSVSKIALRQALAATKGMKDPEPTKIQLPVFIDTVNGKEPKCEPDLPMDADLASSLSTDELKKLLG